MLNFKMYFFQKGLLLTVINIVSSKLSYLDNQDPLIIAHRGACGMFPEHTALAYRYCPQLYFKLIYFFSHIVIKKNL